MGCEKEIKFNFVVAHSLEARAVIDYYRLSKSKQHTAFTVFENNHVRLIVSGQGKLNASAATAYLGGINIKSPDSALWVNVGIAGHRDQPVGSICRVNKITDQQTGRNYFPLAIQSMKQPPELNTHSSDTMNGAGTNVKASALLTVDAVDSTYTQDTLYDMEASGFFQTALRFSSVEKITCFKVVSDNLEHPVDTVDKKNMVRLLAQRMVLIDQYLQHLVNIIYIEKDIQDIDIKHIKTTFSQREMIRELTQSLSVHGIDCSQTLTESVTAGELIKALKNKLNQTQLSV